MEISQKLYSSLLIHIMLKDNFQETELKTENNIIITISTPTSSDAGIYAWPTQISPHYNNKCYLMHSEQLTCLAYNLCSSQQIQLHLPPLRQTCLAKLPFFILKK